MSICAQLCVGSLSPNVSPQDTLTALEGLILLGEQHKLFAMNWFQHQCWGSLLTPCLKVRYYCTVLKPNLLCAATMI